MFGPRKDAEEGAQTQDTTVSATASNPAQPRSVSPAVPRRVVDMPGRRTSAAADGEKKLTVGKGLSLAGEITSCDILVVEGKVEAKLSDGKLIEITEAGQFRGAVEIEAADIAGRFDGNLTVRGRLTIRSTGRISGMVKYGELEVNAGGQIIGEVQVTGGGVQQQQPGMQSFKSAAKFVAPTDEEVEQNNEDERKTA